LSPMCLLGRSRMNALESHLEIDEGLYSRQIYVLGYDAMQRMTGSSVLVSGMKGVGVETAKNIILAGVKSVTVHDQGDAQWSDLSSQFFLSEGDVGQNRAVVSQRHLAELNSYVPVVAYTEELSEKFLSAFQVVVLTNSSLEEQLRISDFCHANNICFILADTKGLDTLGVGDSAGVMHCSEHLRCQPSWCVLDRSRGVCPDPCAVSAGPYHLEIGDTTTFSPYHRGGTITQVKMPQTHSYEPLSATLTHPKIKIKDKGKLTHYCTLHMAFQALHAFQSKMGRLPRPRNQVDADRLLELAQDLAGWQAPLDEELVRAFAAVSAGDLSPINAVIGAMAAQEVLKAASGKFTPLDQWFYFDAWECLPEQEHSVPLSEQDCAPRGSRYDGQIAVFGADFQERLGQQKYFVVGAGAIGCELLKNFGMIGLAAGKGGRITVTDMDTIERSNLNRQFLFRPQDVSKQKSEVAAAAVRHMNPYTNVTAHQDCLGPDTEQLYGDNFFLGLDGVATALDNPQARVYVGERCVQYLKPLLDSGTEGTKGHVQVFVPFLTESYGHAMDLAEKTYPLCTLRHFPTAIQHTLQWARDQFEGLFKKSAENVNSFLQDSNFLKVSGGEALEKLELVHSSLQEKPLSWGECVAWARRLWEQLFRNDIQQLLYNFPPDHVRHSPSYRKSGSSPSPLFPLPLAAACYTVPQLYGENNMSIYGGGGVYVAGRSGGGYWVGGGVHVAVDTTSVDPGCLQDTHMAFILAASRLFAQTHRLQVSGDEVAARQVLLVLCLPPFQPCQGLHIPTTDQELKETSDTVVMSQCKIPSPPPLNLSLIPLSLAPQDDNSNFHLNFIVAASNLRAENYGIPTADWLQSKRIVGRIVPAIATTTAAVAGLVCLELYKLVWGHKDLGSYRQSFLRLAEPIFSVSLPHSQFCQKTWTCWDRIEVPGVTGSGEEMTLGDLRDHLQKEHGLALRMLLYREAVLYAAFWSSEKLKEQLANR
uniref:Ubiquitin-activating enzyme E1 C-terminal domain-containing protein n=1 Tax=Sphenodon punctatus TaxID=8508 RepID=A0A8D0GCC1_SPHPU